jgi:hypothetical protein
MGYDFSKELTEEQLKEEKKNAMQEKYHFACSESIILKISEQRTEAKSQGRWEMIFYYYYLERIMRELQPQQNFKKLYWETPAWKEAEEFFKEPLNVIVGLEELERFCKIHKIKGLEDIKDVIRILPNVIESAK